MKPAAASPRTPTAAETAGRVRKARPVFLPRLAGLPVASERQEQAALFAWLRVAAPPELFATAIPGGDGRETRAPGWVAGTPDCILVYGGRAYFVEMKRTRGGRLSAEQVAAHAAIQAAGGIVVVARGWEDAAAQLRTLVPMRDTRAQRLAVRA